LLASALAWQRPSPQRQGAEPGQAGRVKEQAEAPLLPEMHCPSLHLYMPAPAQGTLAAQSAGPEAHRPSKQAKGSTSESHTARSAGQALALATHRPDLHLTGEARGHRDGQADAASLPFLQLRSAGQRTEPAGHGICGRQRSPLDTQAPSEHRTALGAVHTTTGAQSV
jgi:hypothetical protein